MVHDTADTDSETEAVQEAATVPEGGAGFGGENDVPPASARGTSVVSNASNGGGSPAASADDASLVQGAAHSAFVGGGRPQQAASEVQVSGPGVLRHTCFCTGQSQTSGNSPSGTLPGQ